MIDFRSLSQSELESLWSTLPRGPMPEGVYDGEAWSPQTRWVRIANWAWRGKVFLADVVWNRIFRRLRVGGYLGSNEDEWQIHYPQLHLTDEMRWHPDAGCYLGRAQIRGITVWFTLRKNTEGRQ